MIDLIGQRFGRLVVISRNEKRYNRHSFWNCVCDCGNKVVVNGNHLKTGNTKGCVIKKQKITCINNS